MRSEMENAPSCPAPEAIFAWIEGRIDDPRASAIDDHVRTCASCSREATMARAFVDPSPQTNSGRDDLEFVLARSEETLARLAGEQGRRPWFKTARGIVSGLVAAGLLVFLGIEFRSKLDDGRGTAASDGLELISPIGDVTTLPSELCWEPVTGAAEYRIQIRDVDGERRTEVSSRSTAYALVEAQLHLEEATRYSWLVEALDPTGAVISSSPAADFVICPDPARERRMGGSPSSIRSKRR